MKVSVLIPVYGVERFIEQCAASLFDQSYPDLEFVFVDDCTPDDSMSKLQEVMSRYPNRQGQVRLLRHDVNRGLGAARLTALHAATGDFVINVDSDDFLPVNAIQLLVDQQRQKDADIVSGKIRIYEEGGQSRDLPVAQYEKKKVLKLMFIQNTMPHNLCGRLVRRSLFSVHGIEPVEGVNQAEDYAVTPRLYYAANVVDYVTDVVYYYQVFASDTFSDAISPRHVQSYMKAAGLVNDFILIRDQTGDYSFAIETGMLNVFYLSMKAGVTPALIRQVCHYQPHGLLFRLLHACLASVNTLQLLRLSYLAVKWCYKRWLNYWL